MEVTGEVCIANIGPKERQRRLMVGVVGLIVGMALVAALIVTGAPLWTRALAFLPFVGGAFGFWQYREKT